jgi:integrase
MQDLTAFCSKSELEEITAEDLNRWAEDLAQRRSRRTARNKLSSVAAVLRAAIEDGKRAPLGKLRKIKVQTEPVRAFTPDEVRKLLDAATTVVGWFQHTGIRRCDWWTAFLNCAWDTAMRVSDLLDLEYNELRQVGEYTAIVKTQHKTGRVIAARLRPETCAAIEVIKPQGIARTVVFPWYGWRNKFSESFRRLAWRAGVNGTPKYLRRARATQEAKLRGLEAAAKILGHADATGGLAWRNYIDRSQLSDDLPMPPAIG